ncbi:hypothetical protein BS78_02G044100 [Paspalum vaginatum]|nr:hypothetical protein BS78_02G044100 [Paspalum vaginatum]
MNETVGAAGEGKREYSIQSISMRKRKRWRRRGVEGVVGRRRLVGVGAGSIEMDGSGRRRRARAGCAAADPRPREDDRAGEGAVGRRGRGGLEPKRGAAHRRRFSTDAAAALSALLQLPRGKRWDAVVIGGGHNGLVAVAYLARAGHSIVVLERRGVLGGAAVSESDLVPGFRFSRCSYLLSLLRPAIICELELERHGLKLLPRNPSSFTLCLDDRYLLLGPDAELNHSEISKFSKNDAWQYPRSEEKLEKSCKLMDFVIDSTPPELRQEFHASMIDRMKDRVNNSAFRGQLLRHVMQQGQKNTVEFFDLLLSPASKILNYWFEATLATDAVIGSMAGVHTPGSGYVLLHHVMGETGGQRGVWASVHTVQSEGSWQDSNVREAFAKRCFSLIDEYVPGFSSSVVGYDMLTPPDLEKEFGLTGGNIFHGAMGLDSLFLMRPAKGWSDYRTPVKGLLLCGSGAHPGGVVMGAPGRNAAAAVLKDSKTR